MLAIQSESLLAVVALHHGPISIETYVLSYSGMVSSILWYPFRYQEYIHVIQEHNIVISGVPHARHTLWYHLHAEPQHPRNKSLVLYNCLADPPVVISA